MELSDLVRALVSGDLLAARQWVADAHRAGLEWSKCARPHGLNEREMTIAAGLVELLAHRDGQIAPSWAASVAGQQHPIFLDPGIETMPRTLDHAMLEAPEPLRKRRIYAPRDFLDVR